ncbi:MAG TPA: tripartite tricarboxylate transporter substrate binding protein [Ramlibacter sp.]|nr:tripartite tricarboxylate transporter substrate binding protein [Ramlibacter sp.]
MNPIARCLRAALAAVLCCAALSAAAQATYPNRTIRILVPFAPGGSLDPVARLVGDRLQQAWGQPVIVDNRPGGNTTIATLAAAKAPADGHTLLLTASTHVINPLLMQNLPYDSEKDFIPVATVIKSEFVLVVHPSVPANNLQEFIALARSRPDGIEYASSGHGNANHIAAELFNQTAGVKLRHVPYKGGGQAVQDLLSGQVKAIFSVPFTVTPHIRAGKLKALAHTGAAGLPGVPTFAQAGLPQFDLRSWQAFMVPAGTPRPIVDRLVAEIGKIMAEPATQEKLASTGQEVWFQGPDAFTALMKSDARKFGDIIRSANIRME